MVKIYFAGIISSNVVYISSWYVSIIFYETLEK